MWTFGRIGGSKGPRGRESEVQGPGSEVIPDSGLPIRSVQSPDKVARSPEPTSRFVPRLRTLDLGLLFPLPPTSSGTA